jgi:hypothetical protein
MITVPTTLVLGAGASMPYGFPSGAQLREQLCNPGKLAELTREGSFSEIEIEKFCEAFLRSGTASIDAFLARRGDHLVGNRGATFAQIGKAAIAYALIRKEDLRALHAFENEDNWYQYLWQNLGESIEEIENAPISIVTFNYDRSLEMYLLLAFENAFGISETQAASHLKKISITHVYGQIGELACLSDSTDGGCRSYTQSTSPSNIKVGGAGIKVISEGRGNGPEFAKARAAISSAERLCFLGFGFDSTNVRRLGLSDILRTRFQAGQFCRPTTYATTLGLKRAERNSVISLLSPYEQSIETWMPKPEMQTNYAKIRDDIRESIVDHYDERNTNYLRHTGVLQGH